MLGRRMRSRDMRLGLGVFPASAIATILWAGCSSLGSHAADRVGPDNGSAPGGATSGFGGSGTSIGNDGSKGGTTTPPPPETEKEASYTLPVRSGRWVWSANPDSGKVALIDTQTLEVKLTSGGFAPTYLAPLVVGGEVESAAIVANAKSNDATVMRRVGDEVTRTTVPTHVGVNAWAVSPSGRWAIAWSNAEIGRASCRERV